MSPAERVTLIAEAKRWNAVPLLAYKQAGQILYQEVKC